MLSRAVRLLMLVVVVVPLAAAGSAEDPEVVDAIGDVSVHGAAPPTGFAWADLVSLWFEADAGGVVMRIATVEAPSEGVPGEVAAFLAVNGSYFHTGWTTVLPPFATQVYQGGFVCPSDAEGTVDPATCDSLAGVAWSGSVVTVPLSAERFGWVPGGSIEPLGAYSDVWYLDVQVVVDVAEEGRAFVVPGSDATEPAQPAPTSAAGAAAALPSPATQVGGSDGPTDAGPAREAGGSSWPSVLIAAVLSSLVVVQRHRNAKR